MEIYYVSMSTFAFFVPLNHNKKCSAEITVRLGRNHEGTRMCEKIYDAPICALFALNYVWQCDMENIYFKKSENMLKIFVY